MAGYDSYDGGLSDWLPDSQVSVPDIALCEFLGESIARSSPYSCWRQIESLCQDSFGFGSGAVFFDRRHGSTYSLPAIASSAVNFAARNSQAAQRLLIDLRSHVTRS